MIGNELHLRVIENKDWATVLFVFSLAAIAITKAAFENRFAEFAKLIYTDKYTNIYKDNSNLKSGFTISLFLIQLLSLAFFIHLSINHFEINGIEKTDWVVYIRVLTFLTFFVLSKYLVEKIIATSFHIDEFVEHFNLQKVIYRSYISLFLIPINIIMFYHSGISRNFIVITILTLLTYNIITYVILLKKHQNIIFGKIFYFILYLCALEIAPYYFMYYWFTKVIA